MQLSRKNVDAIKILSSNNLNITQSRKEILNTLLSSEIALSEKEIRAGLNTESDRATVYRTLKIFSEKDIIHTVVTNENITKYLIRKKPDNHLHFRCIQCSKIICLTDVQMSSYNLPDGYVGINTSFVVSGLCDLCNKEK